MQPPSAQPPTPHQREPRLPADVARLDIAPPATADLRRTYQALPFYRRSPFVTGSLGLGLLLSCLNPVLELKGGPAVLRNGPFILGGPCLLIVCLCVLSGPVCYRPTVVDQRSGGLRRWHWGNKIVAALLLLAWLGFLRDVACDNGNRAPSAGPAGRTSVQRAAP